MPWGIGLPDIIEEPLNRVPGVGSLIETDAEKRRRKRRERQRPKTPKGAKKKDDGYDLGDLAKDLLVPGRGFEKVATPVLKKVRAPKIVRSIPKNIAEIGAGVIPAAGAVGRAGWHDLRHRDVPSREDMDDYLRLAKWMIADEKGDKRKRPKTDSEMVGLVAEMLRGWGRGIERALPDPSNPEDVKEARRTWREEPVFAALDLLPVGSAIARGASVGKRVPTLGPRGAIRESYRPGAAAREGREGGVEPRVLRARVGDVDREVPGRPWSRNPLVREAQRATDELYALSPKRQRQRVARAEERLAREEKRRVNLETDEMSMPFARLVYGRVGRLMGSFGLRERMTPVERRRATALAYAFQMPRHMDVDTALAAVQDDLQDIIASGKIEVPGGRGQVKELPLTPEQKQALTGEVATLDHVRRELADGTISGEEFTSALEAMKQIADRTQEMGRDIMARRGKLDDDELAELDAAWANRADMLPRRLAGRGRLGLDLADSPVRQARISEWREALGDDEAAALTAFYDAVARGVRGNDPASFYDERVGMPGAETAEEFMARVGDDALFQFGQERWAHGQHRLIEGAAEAPAGHSIFYSPVQKWVDEAMPRRMQAGQLRKTLERELSAEEVYNLGLDNFLDAFERNEMVFKEDFQNFLANPLNAYNLREIHLHNTRDADEEGFAAMYDIAENGTYVSRDAALGEYHEVLFTLPSRGRDSIYKGKGAFHWEGRSDVAVHFRFHVFEEDGRRKLLLEELQSDWVGDHRTKANASPSPDLSEEEAIRFAELESEWKASEFQLSIARDRHERYEMQRDLDQVEYLEPKVRELEQQMAALNEGKRAGFPKPPLGRGVSARSSYINSPVRWLHRYAAENGVDEIIVASRETHLARNAKALDPRDWQNFAGGEAADVTRWFYDRGPHPTRSYIGYETHIPDAFARELGVDGRRTDDAYDGHYRVPHDQNEQAAGRMPGTVFTMTDEVRARAMKPRSMYQRQPDWDALPKGAVEFAEGGRTRVHAFRDGDVSTWIHELGHTALYDLDDASRKTLETHYAGGKVVDEWVDMEHESFARDFEGYVRRGIAPTSALASVFAKLKRWITEVWAMEKRKGTQLDPEVQRVFDRMFSAPDSDLTQTWGYFPHRDFTELANQEYRGGVRPPAAGQTIGIPRLTGETVQRKGNELLLYQGGRLSADPAQLIDVYLRRMRFQETLNARDELWEMGQSLAEKPPAQAWLIRNPDEAAESIRSEAQAAVRGQPTTQPLSAESLENLEAKLPGLPDEVRREMIARPGEHPEWASDMENVRWVPSEYVETRFGEVFEQRPRGNMWSALGLMTALQRTTGIYMRAPSYVAGNIPFNVMALMASMPVSTLRSAGQALRMGGKGSSPERKALYRAIASETGETRASGGLPEFYIQGQNRLQRTEQRAGMTQRGMADVLSHVADTPFRVTAFLNNARKRGFRTDDELRALIEEGGSELSDIRQMTREQLLDFDALNPTQRRLASSLLYLWPFMYASIKWPFMYAREYPARAAMLANLYGQYSEDVPQSVANLWQEQGIDLGTLNPVGPLAEIAEQAQATMKDPADLNLEMIRERLSPTLSAGAEMLTGGSKNAFQNLVRQTVPGAAEWYSRDPRFRGGKQFADQSRDAYIWQRWTRFFPRGTNPQVIKERIEQHQRDQVTADTHELERDADKKKLNDYIKATGNWSAEDGQRIQQSYEGWWAYQEAVDAKKEASGQKKLTPVQTSEVLTEIIEEHFPEAAGDLIPMDEIRVAKDMSTVEDYNENVKDYINEGRTMVFDAYRSYAAP